MIYKSIGELCDIKKGETGIMKSVAGEYPLVTTGPTRKSCNTYQFDTEAVCIPLVSSTGHGHKSLNYVHYQSGKFALGTILAAVIPRNKAELSAEYLQRYLFFFKDQKIVTLMSGAANVTLSIKNIAKIEVPVPPLDEQKDFIKLFGNIETHSLHLQAEFYNQSSYLTQLRQAILQEAIEGKLTVDWRKENPVIKGDPDFDAEALLEKIKAEKEKLIDEGKIKKQKPLSLIKPEEEPFELPEGWVWTRLAELCKSITDGDHQPPPKAKEGIPFLVISNVSSGFLDFKNTRFVGEDYFIKLNDNRKPKIHDILYTVTGSYGIPIKVDENTSFCVQRHISIIRPVISINNNLLFDFLKSPPAKKQADKLAWGVAVKTVPLTGLRKMLIPLPPLAEQQIIVERVNKLLKIVDQLEYQASDRKSQVNMLMQSVLREAFKG